MQRCLDLAARALGYTWPNPLVGAVIVHDGKIIGEGYHLKSGSDHAEVIAIKAVSDRELLKRSTLYVNLEPCSHYGKTAPCAEMIISCGIPRVVVGTVDTTSKVSGKGIAMLRAADIEVITGVCEAESREINKRFFTFHELNRPYVILKWAMSADGYIDVIRSAGSPVGPYWITGMTERTLVHRWRSEEQAILTGGETIRTDNPRLNVRYWAGNDPLKIIISQSSKLDSGARVFSENTKTLLFTARSDADFTGTENILIDIREEEVAREVLKHLYDRGIQSVIIEGGRRVHDMFISAGLWDEARVFTGRKSWGAGISAPELNEKFGERIEFISSTLTLCKNFVN